MKNVANIIMVLLLGVVFMLCVMTVAGRSGRQAELSEVLPHAVEEALSTVCTKKQYTVADRQELAADLRESIAQGISSDADVTVDIAKSDLEKGIISVHVTAEYRHLNGKTGVVEDERIAILNSVVEPEDVMYTVGFYTKDDECYKIYHVLEGEKITAPAEPVQDGRTFLGWADADGNAVDFLQPVIMDEIYYARWH